MTTTETERAVAFLAGLRAFLSVVDQHITPARRVLPVIQVKAANGRTGVPRLSAAEIAAGNSAQAALEYINGLVRGKNVNATRVGKALARAGFSASTAHPVLSALYRAGKIKKVQRGIYTAKSN